MSDYVLAGCSGFICGLFSWFTLFKLLASFRFFAHGIEDAFRND